MTWHPDAHRDRYVWLAAFGGHCAIGISLWIACLWLGPWWAVVAASAMYAAWEIAGAVRWRVLVMDSLLDWTGVTFGAMTGAFLWAHEWGGAAWCVASCLVIGFAGWEKRR